MSTDFDIPLSPSPKQPKKTVQTPSKPPLPRASAEQAEDAAVAKAKPEYSEEELLRVFDEIIFSGEYEENFQVKGRLQITLRTRTAKELNEIQAQLDSSMFNLVSSLEQKRSYLNLQYALKVFHGKDLSVMPISERVAVIDNIPGPVIYAILDCMSKFDDKVYQACKDGEANF